MPSNRGYYSFNPPPNFNRDGLSFGGFHFDSGLGPLRRFGGFIASSNCHSVKVSSGPEEYLNIHIGTFARTRRR